MEKELGFSILVAIPHSVKGSQHSIGDYHYNVKSCPVCRLRVWIKEITILVD